jgi:acyl-CoA dehydrogenase
MHDRTITATLSDEQRILSEGLRTLLREECPPELIRRSLEDTSLWPSGLWGKLRDNGWTSAYFSAEHGGQGMDFESVCTLLVEAGHFLLPGPYFSSAVATAILLREIGCADGFEPVASGDAIATTGLWERPVTFPLGPVRCRLSGTSAYRVSGTKHFVTDAAEADLVLMVAIDDDGHLAIVSVPTRQSSVKITTHPTIDGRRQCTVKFENAPVEAVLSTNEALKPALVHAVMHTAAAVAALQVGGAAAALAMAVNYAKTRVQFGRPIGTFQAVSHKLVDVYCSLELGKALVSRAARSQRDSLVSRQVDSAMAKAWCNDMYRDATRTALQVHGGIGFTYEHDIHLYLRAAQALAVEYGTTTHHRAVLRGSWLRTRTDAEPVDERVVGDSSSTRQERR